MLNIADTLHRWCAEQRPFALATIVGVTGSAPLPVGTSVAVDADGTAVGSISGGCVEGSVYELCRQVLEDRAAPQRAWFGYSDVDAFAVGLTCGGELDVHVQRIDPATQPHLATALAEVANGGAAAVAQVVDGPAHFFGGLLALDGEGHLSGTDLDTDTSRAVTGHAQALLRAGRTALSHLGGDAATCPEQLTVLVHVAATRPRLLIFGAVDFAAALAQAGRFLGFRVTVCDARPVFATAVRFPHADEVVVDWPHRYLAQTAVNARTAICVLTHDAKFDIPLLRLALTLPVGYVGAMGSRRTHRERLRLLDEARVTAGQLAALHSPIGLDLGARTPEETAVSITAEIIARANGASGLPLSQRTGPIHRTAPRQDINRPTRQDAASRAAGGRSASQLPILPSRAGDTARVTVPAAGADCVPHSATRAPPQSQDVSSPRQQ
ncbi:XdhC family protein [Streptomyces sp. NBC_01775]|uniref:XdhC family protein n=1 Tax=Streptomyces sp. NBC_01775 TaxID=2975939 RepID=UPI002DDADEA3|nr:XdhC/CoxI family protein [Streptomyces sp. NBC_01775]WSB80799.1 XdhC family protein [Streptomyces sp. NBC_01775]